MNDRATVRVLFLTTAFPTRVGDPRGHHVYSMAKQLAVAGASVRVVAPTGPDSVDHEMIDGVDVARFRYALFGRERLATGVSGIIPNMRARPTLALQLPGLLLQMIRAARSSAEGFDLIHAHWLYPAGIAGLRAAHEVGIPLVVTAHGGDVNTATKVPWLRSLARRVGNAADRVLTVSDDLAEKLVTIGVDRDRIAVVPLGVNVAEPVPARDSDEVRILYVGSLIKRKSVATLIDAIPMMSLREFEVHIVGDGPERMQLEKRVRDLGVAEQVVFHGSLSPEATQRIIASSDMLVLPSLSEGRPVVVMEAMAHSLPVVATDIPGTSELVVSGETGALFPPGDVRSLAETLSRLADDAPLRTVYGRAGVERLRALGLTGEASAERHLAVYAEVIGGTPPTHGGINERGRD